jgi:hypothetical protein
MTKQERAGSVHQTLDGQVLSNKFLRCQMIDGIDLDIAVGERVLDLANCRLGRLNWKSFVDITRINASIFSFMQTMPDGTRKFDLRSCEKK